MATAALNPLLCGISGRVGNIVFYTRLGRQCIRVHVIPRNPNTPAQRNMRCTFADAVKSWQGLSAEKKYEFSRKARSLSMSGYNLFISEYMKANYTTAPKIKTEFLHNTHSSNPYSLRFPSVSYSNAGTYANIPGHYNNIQHYMRM